jgi:hypothetical protein
MMTFGAWRIHRTKRSGKGGRRRRKPEPGGLVEWEWRIGLLGQGLGRVDGRYRGSGWQPGQARGSCMKVCPVISVKLIFPHYPSILAVRVEWSKAWNRSQRWSEANMLVTEEMRRVLAFHDSKARWWEERKDGGRTLTGAHAEGVMAYAARQAKLNRDMGARFQGMWAGVDEDLAEVAEVPESDEVLDDGLDSEEEEEEEDEGDVMEDEEFTRDD